jgi:hypothetical protein
MQDERLSPGDELTVARNVVRVHQTRMCPACTDDGCPAEEWAAPIVASVVEAMVAGARLGRLSVADLRAVADEMRGDG